MKFKYVSIIVLFTLALGTSFAWSMKDEYILKNRLLIESVRNSNVEKVKQLIEEGIDVNFRSQDFRDMGRPTALILAAQNR